jgi:hypothetical protein
MTEPEIVSAIALAVPKDRANAEVIAKAMLNLAIGKIGRMNSVSFNRDLLTLSFRSGISSYKLGTDILQKYPNIWNMQELWCTDQSNSQIKIVALDEFNRYARGGTDTGRPIVGTIHSSTATLEVYPIPDSNYTAVAYVKRQITQLSDIPSPYHDVVYSIAIEMICAAGSSEMAASLSTQGMRDIQGDAQTVWDGR